MSAEMTVGKTVCTAFLLNFYEHVDTDSPAHTCSAIKEIYRIIICVYLGRTVDVTETNLYMLHILSKFYIFYWNQHWFGIFEYQFGVMFLIREKYASVRNQNRDRILPESQLVVWTVYEPSSRFVVLYSKCLMLVDSLDYLDSLMLETCITIYFLP